VSAVLKPKKCRACREPFVPWRFAQVACSPKCAVAVAEDNTRRKAAREKRRGLIALRPRREWVKIARDAFNAFIRERARYPPCISCDFYAEVETIGGTFDCGHFRTVGAAPHLRFDEANAHKQCKTCNSGVIRDGTRVLVAHDPERAMTIRAAYRVRLIARIGFAEVDRLENDNAIRRHDVVGLQEIAKLYRAKLRELRKARAA